MHCYNDINTNNLVKHGYYHESCGTMIFTESRKNPFAMVDILNILVNIMIHNYEQMHGLKNNNTTEAGHFHTLNPEARAYHLVTQPNINVHTNSTTRQTNKKRTKNMPMDKHHPTYNHQTPNISIKKSVPPNTSTGFF